MTAPRPHRGGRAAEIRHAGTGVYCCPVGADPVDRRRWRRFVLTISIRIRQTREREGISSARGDAWRTFDPPLDANHTRRGVRA